MKPKQFLASLGRSAPAPAYLFLGNEGFFRDRCRQALVEAVWGDRDPQAGSPEGLIEIDLSEQPLNRLLDEARTLSLFAPRRLLMGRHAEAVLPKRVATRTGAAPPGVDPLADYLADPVAGVVLLFEATRYDWNDRGDKAKLERVAKFYAAVPTTVELTRLTPQEAVAAATQLAKELRLNIERPILSELVEMLGNDMARLGNELEKLALYAADGRAIAAQDLETLIPEARHRGVFEFSDALARKNRLRALDVLDTLARSGEYWPMQINLLAGLFRQALAAKEGGTHNSAELMRQFQQSGVRIWPSRARQVLDIARRFSQDELEGALISLFQADRDLRRERPGDRIIMEQLVVRLTS